MTRINNQGSSDGIKNYARDAQQIAIQRVLEPGCYIDNIQGRLFRVNAEMADDGGYLIYAFTERDDWYVIKISDNPNLSLDECRLMASRNSWKVNF